MTCSNDHTVLSLACTNGHLDVVRFLLRSGADVTHKLKVTNVTSVYCILMHMPHICLQSVSNI